MLEFRKECREYAQHWMDVQSAEFQRLGVAGDWANRYATMDFASEAAIAGEIGGSCSTARCIAACAR